MSDRPESDEKQVAELFGDDGWESRVLTRSLRSAAQRSLDRSRAFINAAIDLLREKGEGFTLDEVSERSGYSLRVFYQHFAGKDDLLIAVLEEEVKLTASEIREKTDGRSEPVARLAGLLDLLFETPSGLGPNHLAMAAYELGLVAARPREVALAYAPERELAREIIEAGIGTGAFHPSSADDGAYLVVALKRAYNYSRLVADEVGMRLPDPAEVIRFCIEGLGGRPADRSAQSSERF